ncbi:MAG: 16S rRNA (cytosine(967)-C(5))-methyltransferase [Rhodocyclales bacterium GWA2_65_20]|nr:MAG: 16S rRNA (cytosine(967)-C(5))-methyltransferase [Rhodocyclales bacterium GWA2_65_20]
MSAAPLAAALSASAQVIAAVIGGRSLDEALAAARLEGVTRAAAQNLTFGALRRYGRGDFFLAQLIERPLGDPLVRGLLLAALHRIDERPADAHTTVDQAVRAAAAIARGKWKGLVNGVLRNFLRRQAELEAAAAGDDVARCQLPRWWLDQLITAYPRDWEAVAAAGNGHPPMCLRVNRRQGDAGAYLADLHAAGIAARSLDDTAVLLAKPVPVERLPGFGAGRVSVQDWGAQHAARLLDARAGMRVLDACAAPGGKTCHLLELADLDLVAVEAEAARVPRIAENLARLGLAAAVRVADCRSLDAWWDGRPFDRILADVPCSATGAVRRHPDIKWLRRAADVDKFARTQAEILDALWLTLAPGGRMLYCTCSVLPAENARQVAAFAVRHAEAIRLPLPTAGGDNNEWQLLPSAEHDGFFYALLEKSA